MILINGSEGIGTGYSTNIPPFNPLDIIKNIKSYIAGTHVDKLNELQEWLSPFLPKKTEKLRSEPREKPASTIRIPKENPFDKFQSEF